jgi:hypothetical protein
MTMTGQRRVYALLAALVVGLAASATSVSAHPRVVTPLGTVEVVPAAATIAPVPAVPPAPAVPAPAAPPMRPLPPSVALAVALGVALTARRRVLVTALALVLVVLAVETGVHSVHHIADRQGAADCVVAMASANVHGTAASSPMAHALWIPGPVGAVVAPAPERPGARPLRPDEGRAPPAAA